MKLPLGIIGIPRVAKQSGNGRAAGSFGRGIGRVQTSVAGRGRRLVCPIHSPAIHFQEIFQKDKKLSTSRLTHLCKTK
jgi:hypothetical protein